MQGRETPEGTRCFAMDGHDRRHDGDVEIHEFRFRIPTDLHWFRGHFEDHPVLPAVVQLHEALRLTRRVWPDLASLRRVVRAKFRKPIRPDDSLRVLVHRRGACRKATFEYVRSDGTCSSGAFEFD